MIINIKKEISKSFFFINIILSSYRSWQILDSLYRIKDREQRIFYRLLAILTYVLKCLEKLKYFVMAKYKDI